MPYFLQAIELDMEKAIDLAISSDEQLLASKEDLRASQGEIITSRSMFLPEFSLSSRFTKLSDAPVAHIPAGIFGEDEMTFPMGTQEDFELSITASQPLFTGGKIWQGYKISKAKENIATEEIRRIENQLVYDVRSAYIDLLLTERLIEVTEESLNRARDHYQVAKDRYDVGLSPRFEMLRTEVEVTNLDSNLKSLKNTKKVQLQQLKSILNIPDDEVIILKDNMEYIDFSKDIDECKKEALTQRPELKTLDFNREILDRSISIAQSGYYPDLYLQGQFTTSSDDIETGDHYQNIFSATLQLSWTFFDWFGTYGEVITAKAKSRSLEYIKSGTEQSIELEVENIYQTLKSTGENLIAQQANISLAEESLRMVEDQYNAGLATNLDVLDSQLALHNAKLGYYRSLNEYLHSYYNLIRAMGQK
jgi:outer membrane protein TolC